LTSIGLISQKIIRGQYRLEAPHQTVLHVAGRALLLEYSWGKVLLAKMQCQVNNMMVSRTLNVKFHGLALGYK
jgi:hypothetical protein